MPLSLPTLIFARVCGLLLMPGLSRAKNDAEEFLRQCGLSTALCLGCGVFMTTFFAIGGKSVLMLAYGERYAMGNDLLMWLAIGQAVRVIRVAPTIIANSQAKTKNAMYSNMVRTLAIPAALILIRLGFGVKWIAITALCGEVLAMIASYRMLSFGVYKGQFMRQSLAMGAGFLLLSLAAFAVFGSLRATASVLSNLALVLGGGVVGISTAVLVTTIDPGTREQARQVVRRVVRRVREKLATRRS